MDSWSRSVFGTWDQSEVGTFEVAMRKFAECLGTSRRLSSSPSRPSSQRPLSLRRKDGDPFQINVSLPTSRQPAVVIGARYLKGDGTHTEDCFLFTPGPDGFDVVPYYKGSIEGELPEYGRTHKQYVDAFDPGPLSWRNGVGTDSRTITFTRSIGDSSAAPF